MYWWRIVNFKKLVDLATNTAKEKEIYKKFSPKEQRLIMYSYEGTLSNFKEKPSLNKFIIKEIIQCPIPYNEYFLTPRFEDVYNKQPGDILSKQRIQTFIQLIFLGYIKGSLWVDPFIEIHFDNYYSMYVKTRHHSFPAEWAEWDHKQGIVVERIEHDS